MARYIDADEFKRRNERLLHCDFPYLSEATLEELIDSEPTADAVPMVFHDRCMEIEIKKRMSIERKKGEWEEIEVIADAYDISGVKTWASKMMCDQCGFTTIAIEGYFSQYNFCPNCGADMRGSNNDN